MTTTLPDDAALAAGDDGDGGDDGSGDELYDDGPRGGPRAARIAAISVGVVLLLFIGLLATRKSSEDRFGSNPLVGRAVPAVAGKGLEGETVDIATMKGKWVVVNFFATWCTGCRIEHPELVKFSKAHQEAGDAEVVSVAFQDQAAALQSYFDKNGGDWPVIVDDTSNTALTFGITGIPESFIVAPNGLVVEHFNGVTAEGLDRVINAYGGKGVTVAGQTGAADGTGTSTAPQQSGPGTTVKP